MMQDRMHREVERFFKTDSRYLFSGGFWLSLTKVFAMGVSFLTSIAFANLLPEHTYGVYRYVLSLLPILTIPTLNGIDTALTRAVARGKESTLYPALSLKVTWGLLGGIASLAVALYYYLNGNIELTLCFLIASLFIPLMDPFGLFVAHLAGRKDFKRQTIYQILTKIVPAALLIGTVFVTSNVFVVIAVYFVAYTLLRLFFLVRLMRDVPKSGPTDNESLGLGKHLSLMGILGVISTSLDKILIFHFSGGAVLAGYYLALMPYKQLSSIFGSITTLALPKLAEKDAATIIRTLPAKVWKSYLIVVPMVVGYILVAPYAFELLYPKYVEHILLSQIFVLLLLLLPISIFHTAITAQADKKKLYASSISYAVIRIVLLLVLTPLFGIWGAVASILGTNLLSNVITIFLFYRLR